MPHHTPLIATIAAGIGLAFIFGVLAHRLRVSPLVGYLVAGVLVGPFTPGFVADQALATELAELGIILLMFGVGLHFSLEELLSVRAIAIPGAIAQMAVATLMAMALAHLLGWPWTAGLVFGLALSVASTVVLLRALQTHHILRTERGRIAVGWLIVEDLATVLALVLLPILAEAQRSVPGNDTAIVLALAATLAKVLGFIAFMLIVGRRLIPAVLHYVAHTGSRELFRLAVFASALSVAFVASALFGVSFALGAFFAGMVLSESKLSQRAAEETLPLRDAFAVLFFVSVGMLFDPSILIEQPLPLLGTIAIVVLGKSLAAYVIVRAFGHSNLTALTVSAGLAQIGEFSFILAGLAVSLQLLPEMGRDLILAGAIVSILLNPAAFALLASLTAEPAPVEPSPAPPEQKPETDLVPTALSQHDIVVGYGRVGQAMAADLREAGRPFLVIEDHDERVDQARNAGCEVIPGNAAEMVVLDAAGVTHAHRLLVAIPDGFEAGQVVEQARKANSQLNIVVRAHTDDAAEHLQARGATSVIMGERELARSMLESGEAAPA